MARDGSVFRYNPDYLREQFAGLVIQRALPFDHFDHEQTTRVFQNTMQPRYTHVSRSTLKRDAMRLWLAAKQEIIDSFGNLDACVNLTTNVWPAPHGVPGSYMYVTAHWIEPSLVIQRALPFDHFDHEQTARVFQNTMQPRYTHVSRSTLKRDAMRLWLAAKQEIIDTFGNINACVNLTTNVWPAPHGVPGSYMYVTAHWIEPSTWQMMKRIISFEEFSYPHTGGALFKMLIKVLTNFNLEDKVMSITLDNASNNTSAMDKLKLEYDPPMGASESAFSTSGRVLSIRRTKLTLVSLEMCMCLKDHFDAKERKQDKCPLEIPLDFKEDVFDDEVQRNEAIPLSDKEITLDASSEGTRLREDHGRFDVFFRNQLLVFQQHRDESLYDSWTHFKDIIRKVSNHGLSIWTLIEIFLKHLDSLSHHIINLTAEGDLRKFSDIGA
nr:zinc finger BED domain-containing protein RICESLEEPER 2 [Tanacetum cinerariifolium]